MLLLVVNREKEGPDRRVRESPRPLAVTWAGIIAVMRLRRVHLPVLAVCSVLGAVTSCISVPEGYESWKQVNREYESRDYINTLNYLDDLLKTDNDYTARAAALKVVILGGMTRSALEIEDACAKGIYKVARGDFGPYKSCMERFRWQARTSTLGLMDALNELEKRTGAAATVPLDFSLPDTTSEPSPMIGRTLAGSMPAEKVFEPSVARILDRQIFLQVCDLVAAGDAAAVKDQFESPPVTTPKEAFLVGAAKTLLAAAAVFAEDRLADPAKRSATLKRARECLQPALDRGDATLQSEAKALAKEISEASRR
jgi:hypothetical protein